MNHFKASNIVLARKSRGFTQSGLAAQINRSVATVNKIENERMLVSDELAPELARVLNYPMGFFSAELNSIPLPNSFYRKRRTIPAKVVDPIKAQASILMYRVSRLLEPIEDLPVEINRIDLDEEFDGQVRIVAEQFRRHMAVPPGPIKNLVEVIERAGIIVVPCDFGTRKIDAISFWSGQNHPVILTNSGAPGDRLRFSLGHELGHLVMHDHRALAGQSESDLMEKEADAFASHLLMPRSDIRPYLRGLKLSRLPVLKAQWRVSMASLVMCAHDSRTITDRQKMNFFKQLSRNGWRVQEPVEVSRETPWLLSRLLKHHLNQLGYSIDELAEALWMSNRELEAYLRPDAPRLRVV